MKTIILPLVVIMLLSVSCNDVTTKTKTTTNETSQKYTGPIIDMHIHAYDDGNPLFGITHPPTLRGKTYKGVASALEQKKKTLEKFHKHNIVKAVVTNGSIWFDEIPETILIAGAHSNIDTLKAQHQAGNLKVMAEMAPFYAGMLATDPSLFPHYQLAQELNIPVGVHILPGGPNNGFHLMPEMLGGMRTYNANPLQLEDVLVKFPNIKLYIMHGGWPYVEDVKALMYAHANVYVDIAVLDWIMPQGRI